MLPESLAHGSFTAMCCGSAGNLPAVYPEARYALVWERGQLVRSLGHALNLYV